MASTTETKIVSQPEMVRLGQSPMKPRKRAIWDAKIVWRAILDSFLKLDPRHMMGNPVMFVVEVGSVITTVLLARGRGNFAFNLQITLWLWFTVLLMGVIIIVGALTFFPALSLGPILEHLLMGAGKTF